MKCFRIVFVNVAVMTVVHAYFSGIQIYPFTELEKCNIL